jgi:hypothetical protein
VQLPEYITKEEVQRVCQELAFRDWTKLTEAKVLIEEARTIQAEVGAEALEIPLDEFRLGLEIELEHGVQFPDSNVTNNHPILTGMIVLAHLKEMLDYYLRLEVAELEGDLLKASLQGDVDMLSDKFKQLIEAQANLSQSELKQLGG